MAGGQGRGGGGIARGGQGGRAGKAGSHRKGAALGSGGQRRKALQGKGATPPAEMRPGHPAQRRAAAAANAATRGARRPGVERAAGAGAGAGAAGGAGPAGGSAAYASRRGESDEYVVGRNAVVEALRAGVPATTLLIAGGLDFDERVADARRLAGRAGLSVVDIGRIELDRLCPNAPHQGLALTVPPYSYAHPDDLLAAATRGAQPGLVVALDGVTDPRNLGAVVRSAAAFGATGVVVPERRAAGMTAAAWKTSAGAAARLPVARAVNLTRTLRSYAEAGLFVAGLAADGEVSLDDLEVATDPLVVVVGSEGRGLSRLVGECCDLRIRIPMAGATESLNAGVATGIALAEIARRRRQALAAD
ncbi:23S rRNA (guanosine(2251)-2'-O)-methyltransferase RlmB [Parafrankia colletiae]|uniref:23S rRNA (Guanosine(2251)-2'-O)-methyltransferase RlmB n=1 Tax=Parafrankia colletiae TaxID=573497 RepID=A0A1S1Q6I4_9ACTN|nr:23S rRNA (guanosine(2251)-2'-O)-methyltransferase RlmB [Parafrankia colletiae]MCK9904084.1 23S rRNA (guanosine(2251)-2'-O)-methyltransferase RlmB [Frankia sp. Cpl3]OHV29197.1 23S rRNA (guanosine(2251)-2'-O)-methyltransferase RlmB [Parafrankia colletiae]